MADNSTFDQVKNFSSGLGTSQKIAIGGATAVVLILLVMIFANASSGNMQTLYTNLEEADAGRITEYLKENEIEHEIANNGRTIKVEKDRVNEVRLSLASQGIPGESNVGYEIFDETNLGMSEFVQKVNFRRALEGELSRTIKSFDEVKKARVHIVLPETALFEKDQKPPTASVTLHLSKVRGIGKSAINGIQNLVANSVEGMQVENVKITDQSGRLLTEDPVNMSSVAGVTEAQYMQKKKVEEYLEQKVQGLMDGVLGIGNAQIRVNTELDFTKVEQHKTNFDPESQVARSEQVINEESKSADSLSFPYVNMSKDEVNSITNYEISKNIEHIIKEVGAIKKLSVAAMINGSTEVVKNEEGTKVEYSPRSEDEMKKFEEIIKNAVGFDPNRNDQVSVINIPFKETFDVENYEIPKEIPWYQNPDLRKIILLLFGILVVGALMFTLTRSSFVREKIRVALSLPSSNELDLDEMTAESLLGQAEDDDLSYISSDLPDQMMLEGEQLAQLEGRNLKLELEEAMAGTEEQNSDENQSLERTSGADVDISSYGSMSEDRLMKLEIKKKVENFLVTNTDDAVKLMKSMIKQDVGKTNLGD